MRSSSLIAGNKIRRKPARGFTLIEIMIVIAILAILVGIAVPSYLDQVRKARRADATASLMDTAQYLERCFTRENAYTVSDTCPDPAEASADGFYTIGVVRDATSYTLTATPVEDTDQEKDACGEYTLDHLGNKAPTPDGNRCWGS